MRKFSFAVLLLLAVFALQFFLASLGLPPNLALASLVAFAFIFPWPELVALDLLLILILNWQPAISAVLVACGIFPPVVAVLKNMFPWQPSLGVPIASALGAVLVAVIGTPIQFASFGAIVADAALTAVCGFGIWWLIAQV
jgi:hypothetical protein